MNLSLIFFNRKFDRKFFLSCLVVALILSFVLSALPTNARVVFSGIGVYDIQNGTAKIKWSTPDEPTKAMIYYGTDPKKLTYQMGYSRYDYYHVSALTGLRKDRKYYYKIVAITPDGRRYETYLHVFNTYGMEEPIYENSAHFRQIEIMQLTHDAAAIRWLTDIPMWGSLYYGLDRDQLKYRLNDRKMGLYHEQIIYNLEPATHYYFKIIATDEDDRRFASPIKAFDTRVQPYYYDRLTISEIKPIQTDNILVSIDDAELTWETNLVARSAIYYGINPQHLDRHIVLDNSRRNLRHKVVLKDLQPDTTYYYRVEAYDSLYNLRKAVVEGTFATKPFERAKEEMEIGKKITSLPTAIEEVKVLGVEYSPDEYHGYNNTILSDADQDGLSYEFELTLGTDPEDADSDDDGYNDGLEVATGHNPLGPGRALNPVYGKQRLGYKEEADKKQELRRQLEAELGRKLNLSIRNWLILSDAYVYGGYPVHAIKQALKFGGKTVHPTIGWEVWKNSKDYKEYIQKN